MRIVINEYDENTLFINNYLTNNVITSSRTHNKGARKQESP